MMYNPSAKLSHEESSGGLSHRDSAGDLGLEETSSRYEDDDEAVRTRRRSTSSAHRSPLPPPPSAQVRALLATAPTSWEYKDPEGGATVIFSALVEKGRARRLSAGRRSGGDGD